MTRSLGAWDLLAPTSVWRESEVLCECMLCRSAGRPLALAARLAPESSPSLVKSQERRQVCNPGVLHVTRVAFIDRQVLRFFFVGALVASDASSRRERLKTLSRSHS